MEWYDDGKPRWMQPRPVAPPIEPWRQQMEADRDEQESVWRYIALRDQHLLDDAA